MEETVTKNGIQQPLAGQPGQRQLLVSAACFFRQTFFCGGGAQIFLTLRIQTDILAASMVLAQGRRLAAKRYMRF
jgi:hypothetical protein